jgi:hypothetical protein
MELEAQKSEALMFERMYATADQMLDKDRIKINKKILQAQGQLRKHLKLTGGSRRQFMEQGGFSVLNNISNDIIRSDESVIYQENKKNLAKILEIKEKGLGHLLAPTDLQSIEDYEKNPDGGRIKYSGILSEVEIPPSDAFDYDTDIPLEKILSYKSNAIRIRENYKINYPDRPDPTWEELISFAKKMGYGGVGSNTIRIREQMNKEQARARYNKNNKKDRLTNSWLNNYKILTNNKAFRNLTMEEINQEHGGNLYESLSKDNAGLRKILGEKAHHKSRNRLLSEKGLDWTDVTPHYTRQFAEDLLNHRMGLKESYNVLPHQTINIAKALLGEEGEGNVIEGKTLVDFLPDKNMYRMDGAQLTYDNVLDPDDHRGDYEILGVVSAMETKVAGKKGHPDTSALLVNIYNDDGTIDEKRTKRVDDGYTSGVTPTLVFAMQNKNGDLFYKKVDIENPSVKSYLSEEMGAADDITDTVDQENQSLNLLNAIENNTTEEQIKFQGAINTMQDKVFDNNPMFKGEGEKYWGSGSAGQLNRNDLMQSFYMAADFINNSYQRNEQYPNGNPSVGIDSTTQMIDHELFTTSMIQAGLENELKDYSPGNDETDLIKQWLVSVNQNEDENSLGFKQNVEIAKKWLQLYEMM